MTGFSIRVRKWFDGTSRVRRKLLAGRSVHATLLVLTIVGTLFMVALIVTGHLYLLDLENHLAQLARAFSGRSQSAPVTQDLIRPLAASIDVAENIQLFVGVAAVLTYLSAGVWLTAEMRTVEQDLMLKARAMENAREGMVITDAAGAIRWINSAFTRTTGYVLDDVFGKNPQVLKSNRHGPEFYEQMWSDLLGPEGLWRGEIWNRRRNGEVYPEWLSIQAVRNRFGQVTNYVAVFSDLTEERRVFADVVTAGKIQRGFLPGDMDHPHVTVRTVFQPAAFVSGDVFDYGWHSDTKLYGFMIDVMGHGYATALQTAAIRVLFRTILPDASTVAERMARINRESSVYFTDGSFGAAMAFEFDLAEGTLRYCSAGINRFYIGHGDALESVKVPGLFLGIDGNAVYEEHTLPIVPGAGYFFLTDGLTDILGDSPPWSSFAQFVKLLQESPSFDDGSAMCIQVHAVATEN